MIVNGNKIYADEGMILTDGMHYGTEVKLAECASADIWREITEEEYNGIMSIKDNNIYDITEQVADG